MAALDRGSPVAAWRHRTRRRHGWSGDDSGNPRAYVFARATMSESALEAAATGVAGGPTAFTRVCTRHFHAALLGVLVLAALNSWHRVDHEVLTEWDESLYATTAAEIATRG